MKQDSAAASSSRPVAELEVVTDEQVPPQPGKTWLSPISGGAILFLDNIFFGANLSSGMLATPLICTLAFFATGTSVFFIQKVREGDSWRSSGFKALVSGMVAAVPTSIVGTAFGSLVLFASGLHVLSRGGWRKPWRLLFNRKAFLKAQRK